MTGDNKTLSEMRLSRRDFLKVSSLAGGGLLFGLYVSACSDKSTGGFATGTAVIEPTGTALEALSPGPTDTPSPQVVFEPNIFLTVGSDDTVTIRVHKSEMGQGVRTSLPMLIAEELEADWSTIRVEQAPADSRYGNQVTGGSTSIRENYLPVRRAGAVAREMLLMAAAQTWQVSKSSCYVENGVVIHRDTNRFLRFGELVEAASAVNVPPISQVHLKNPADFKWIGTRVPRIDGGDIVTGRAVYGLDVKIPGMLYAAVARAPMVGGELESYEDAEARAIQGVREVIEITEGVAVVAESTWAAFQGQKALKTVWREGRSPAFSTESLRADLLAQANEDLAANAGDQTLQAVYEVPYLAHATMEPMNCVAHVRPDGCEVWAPTQSPMEARQRAQRYLDLADENIIVHVTLLGGGFGRRLQVDYVGEAVQVSRAVNAPVQVVWTREDDIQHDFYHPFTVHLARARLDQLSLPVVKDYNVSSGAPTGPWRSVTNMPQAFVRECFLDEMAFALGMDPLEIRRQLEPGALQGVLEAAAARSGWSSALPEGWGRGIACHRTWNSTSVAVVAEVSVDPDGAPHVQRIVCAVDCGTVVNPDMVEAQMEGGIAFGLTAALKGNGITFENGQAQQSNFDDYPLFRFDEMPEIEVIILPSTSAPQGVGEMSSPPVIPAVANAVFAATGKRIRRIPISAEDLTQQTLS